MKAGLGAPVHQAPNVFIPHALWEKATSETSQIDSQKIQILQKEGRGPAFSCLDEKDLGQEGSVPGGTSPREADSSTVTWCYKEHKDLHAHIQCIH